VEEKRGRGWRVSMTNCAMPWKWRPGGRADGRRTACLHTLYDLNAGLPLEDVLRSVKVHQAEAQLSIDKYGAGEIHRSMVATYEEIAAKVQALIDGASPGKETGDGNVR
jgi:hypothetical protein